MAKKSNTGGSRGSATTTTTTSRPLSSSSDAAAASASASAGPSQRILTQFSRDGKFFAQATLAYDAQTVRVYEVGGAGAGAGQCTARWSTASMAASSLTVTSMEWAELAADGGEAGALAGAGRGRKRRKSSSAQDNGGDEMAGAGAGAGTGAAAAAAAAASSTTPTTPTIPHILCIGLTSGTVILLHPTQSSVIGTLSQPSSSASASSPAIHCLSYPPRQSTHRPVLWASTSSGQLLAWTLPDASGSNARCIARCDVAGDLASTALAVRHAPSEPCSSSAPATVDALILVAHHSIKLYQTTIELASSHATPKPKPLQQQAAFTGHAAEVTSLLWLDSDAPPSSTRLFASSARNDRTLNVWALPTTGSPSAEGSLSATVALEDSIRRIAPSADGKHLSAVMHNGSAVVASLPTAPAANGTSSSSKHKRRSALSPLDICTSVSGPSDGTGFTDAFLPAVTGEAAPARLCLARSTIKPAFDTVRIRTQDGQAIPNINLEKRGVGNSTASTVLLADGLEGVPQQRAKYTEPARSAVVSGLPAASTSGADSLSNGATTVVETEQTLAQQLRSLQVEQQTAKSGQQPSAPNALVNGAAEKPARRIADATSLSQSLVQALHSSDTRLLETCLQNSDPKVIRSTVRRLPNQLVLPLVESLVERLSRKRQGFGMGTGGVDASRGFTLVDWLRHVLTIHLAYLVTVPALVSRLASLHSTLDSRTTYHSQLLALNGRLDLVVSQIDVRSNSLATSSRSAAASRRAGPSHSGRVAGVALQKQGPARYVEGINEDEEEEEEISSEGEEVAVAGPSTVKAVSTAVPELNGDDDAVADEEDIEDLVMGTDATLVNGDASSDEEEASEEDDEEDEMPAKGKKGRAKAKANGKRTGKAPSAALNGFLELEAEESDNEGEDDAQDAHSRRGAPFSAASTAKLSLLNGSLSKSDDEDVLDDEDDDDDAYESDFINDESEEDGEDSDDEE